MNKLIINGKEYVSKPFDFNLICDLEDMGLTMEQISAKPMSMLRAYSALCIGKGNTDAGKEIESHIVSGGAFDDIMKVMSDEIEKSGFFQSFLKGKETETLENGNMEA